MTRDSPRRGKPGSHPLLFAYALFTAAAVVFLLLAGAMVTSTGSGLAVPDWPLSFGKLMPEMEGGVFYEHGHRMVAAGVGLLIVFLAVWLWRVEPRAWMRRLGWITLGLVVAQGVLGGATVLLKLPVLTSASHACLAQGIFLLITFIALALSKGWNTPRTSLPHSSLPHWATAATVAIYVQLILGAVMRHMEAGLVIPDWPLSFGRIVPPTFTPEVAIHFAHRTWAYGVAALVLIAALTALRVARGRPAITTPAILMLVLTAIQITLGASIIWTQRQAHVTSTHVVTGAILLATAFVLSARSWQSARTAEEAHSPASGEALPGKVSA